MPLYGMSRLFVRMVSLNERVSVAWHKTFYRDYIDDLITQKSIEIVNDYYQLTEQGEEQARSLGYLD